MTSLTVSTRVGSGFFAQLGASVRLAAATMFGCCVLYTLAVYGVGQAVVPFTADGSLLYTGQGGLVGSKAIGQTFTRPGYFWPRPSAVGYDAAAAGGSNLSPASSALRERAAETLARLDATPARPAPADLVTASGSGLDPDITLDAAAFQADRVARARGLSRDAVMQVVDSLAYRPGGPLTREKLVNVLQLNLALDGQGGLDGQAALDGRAALKAPDTPAR